MVPSGYIQVDNGSKNLFYWLFESRSSPSTDPVILWMSGGPGCSSQLALFGENGPYQVDKDLQLSLNPHSWNNNATVIWIDQPTGTGFSYGGVPVHNEGGVAADVVEFLQVLLNEKYDGKYKDLPFHIFGESYAGHYVPAVARAVLRSNADSTQEQINLSGIAIGNGLTDPAEQYKYYVPYSEEHGLVSEGTLKLMSGIQDLCEPLIKACNTEADPTDSTGRIMTWAECLNAYTFCNIGEITPVQSTGVNPYDVRRPCGKEQLCYDFSDIDSYLNQADVKEALGIPSAKKWSECNHVVDIVMVYGGDWMKSYASAVKEILEAGVPALVYAGEYDFICNWMGNDAWTQSLEWSGNDDFAKAVNTTWTTEAGDEAGSYRTAKGLTFLKVKDAGHMAPRDQPYATLDMVRKHLNGFFQ